MGNTQEIPQGEGGEQGDPPHANALLIGGTSRFGGIQRRLIDGEKLLAYFDDVTVICSPERVRAVLTIIGEELAHHAQVSILDGKTQVWNRGGATPPGVEELTRLARLVEPEAVVWRGDTRCLLHKKVWSFLVCPLDLPILCVNSWRTSLQSKISCLNACPCLRTPEHVGSCC